MSGLSSANARVGWIAMAFTLAGCAIQSLKPEWLGYSFVVFLGASALWLINAVQTRNPPLAALQGALVLLNAIAIYRWLG